MTTPGEQNPIADPATPPVPVVPEPVPPSVPTDQAIRDLAAELNKPALDYEPATFRKGVISAIAVTSTPPTVSITISGATDTVIDGVRFYDNFSPQVGLTVNVGKQGTDIWVDGHIAEQPASVVTGGGWTLAALGSGFSHNGDSQGDVYYRRVMQDGAWKMQWKGAVARSANTTVISAALGTDYRPVSRRKLIAARGFGGGSVAVQVVFQTNGTVTLDGSTYNLFSGTTGGGSGVTGSHTGHQHQHDDYYGVGQADFGVWTYVGGSHNHSFSLSGGSLDISVSAPDWVSFNGLEYFL